MHRKVDVASELLGELFQTKGFHLSPLCVGTEPLLPLAGCLGLYAALGQRSCLGSPNLRLNTGLGPRNDADMMGLLSKWGGFSTDTVLCLYQTYIAGD